MFLSQRWISDKLKTRVELVRSMEFRFRLPLSPFAVREMEKAGENPFLETPNTEWQIIHPGEIWGFPRMNFVLKTSFQIPEDWNKRVGLYLPLGEAGDFSHPEALVFIDGEAWSSNDRHHQLVPLDSRWQDGKEHSLILAGWTGGVDLPAVWSEAAGQKTAGFLRMKPCELVAVDEPTHRLANLADALIGTADGLDEMNPVRASLFHACNDAFDLLDTRFPLGEAFYESVPKTLQKLEKGIQNSGAPLDVSITSVGHAHIDVAWLWTLAQARQKARCSFSNVIRLMDEFPEFVFVQSQAQLYDYIRSDDPALFQAIRERAKEGRWEPVGGMWVESDCNLTGPESLVRQFLLGKDFFDEHLEEVSPTRILWLPDVFGFCWSLPQLARQAGLDYFFTVKLGWSEYN